MLNLASQSYQMFYTLSKALLFLIQPTVWLMVLILLAFFHYSVRWRKKFKLMSLGLFVIFGNPMLYREAIKSLEYPRTELKQASYQHGIVLGGYGEFNSQSRGLELFGSADRLTMALALYKQGSIQTILLSSGVHEEGHPEQNESRIAKEYLIATGVDPNDILSEENSWNTHQNALMTAELIGLKPGEERKGKDLLITSAFHMNRAIACFEKQGIYARPYPVDFIYDDEPSAWSSSLLPSIKVLMDWQVPIKEWVGTAVYRLKGYI